MASQFEGMVVGLPADANAAQGVLREELRKSGSLIANASPQSPFFRLLAAIFTTPLLYLRGLIVETILPGMFTQTASGAQLDTLAEGMGEVRKPAAKAEGQLTFYRKGESGDLTIPQGLRVESPKIDGRGYRLSTTNSGVILEGQRSALIPVVAAEPGQAANLGDGYYSILPEPPAGVSKVANEAGWLTRPGQDTESDADLRLRLRLKWRRMSGWHTMDTYRSLISDVAGIDPTDVYFELSAPRGPGSADAYILNGSALPTETLVQRANDYINKEGHHGLGDDLQVKAMPARQIALELKVLAASSISATEHKELQAGIEALLRAAFRESAAYPNVPRVAPFRLFSRSALSAALHEAFHLVKAVKWIDPIEDMEPEMTIPVLKSLTLTLETRGA